MLWSIIRSTHGGSDAYIWWRFFGSPKLGQIRVGDGGVEHRDGQRASAATGSSKATIRGYSYGACVNVICAWPVA